MLWRFHAASDCSVSAMISRDCDSWLSFREAIAVKIREYIKGNIPINTIINEVNIRSNE